MEILGPTVEVAGGKGGGRLWQPAAGKKAKSHGCPLLGKEYPDLGLEAGRWVLD